jgi:hypothetical protein
LLKRGVVGRVGPWVRRAGRDRCSVGGRRVAQRRGTDGFDSDERRPDERDEYCKPARRCRRGARDETLQLDPARFHDPGGARRPPDWEDPCPQQRLDRRRLRQNRREKEPLVSTQTAQPGAVAASRNDRFTTLPGILTALAGLLTAVGTVIGVLYGTHAVGGSDTAQPPRHGVTVTYPSRPAEGIATRATIATRKNGPAALSVPSPVTQLWATFALPVLPVSRRVTINWRRPDGVVARIDKPATPTVRSYVSSRRPLPTGTWHATLSANGLVIKDVAITINADASGGRYGDAILRGRGRLPWTQRAGAGP